MHSFKIINKSGTKITISYNTEDGLELITIHNEEKKKVNLPDNSDKIVYIKRYDKVSSSLCIGNHPWDIDSLTNSRAISPLYYTSFDCMLDVSGFYSTLIVYENSYSLGDYKLFSFYSTEPDRIIKYNYQNDRDRKKLKLTTLFFLLSLRFFFVMIAASGIYGVVSLNDYFFGFLFFIIGFCLTLFSFKWAKVEKNFEQAKLKEILNDGKYVRIKKRSNHYIVYDYVD